MPVYLPFAGLTTRREVLRARAKSLLKTEVTERLAWVAVSVTWKVSIAVHAF